MARSRADKLPPLVGEFRKALVECERLYRTSALECAWYHPELVDAEPREFVALMNDLHRALLVKIFVDVAHIDWHWNPAEEALAAELFEHIWNARLEGDRLREALDQLIEKVDLGWPSVIRPFARFAALRDRAGELETLVLRIGNLVAKADGQVQPQEAGRLEYVQARLRRYLYSNTFDKPGRHELAGVAGQQAVQKMKAEAGSVRAQCALDVKKAPPVQEKPAEERLKETLAELDALIGLEGIKHEIHTLVNFLKMQKARVEHGLPETPVSLHMVFTGNPGTGKTTVARIVGRLFGAMGILAQGHLIETDRSGLVAEYAGQTGPKTNEKVDEALDGVLFIDEAYSLAGGRDDSFGAEAIQTLLKRMEDDRERLVIILAGYPRPIEQLLKSNPGLSSRFSRRFEFPDYTAVELGKIFQWMCQKNHFTLTPRTRAKLLLGFEWLLDRRDEHFGNGRLARNVFELALRRLANRIVGVAPLTKKLLTTLEAEEIALRGVPSHVWDGLENDTHRFRVSCPSCEKSSSLGQTYLGRRVKCKRCSHKFAADWGDVVRG